MVKNVMLYSPLNRKSALKSLLVFIDGNTDINSLMKPIKSYLDENYVVNLVLIGKNDFEAKTNHDLRVLVGSRMYHLKLAPTKSELETIARNILPGNYIIH